MRNIYKTGMLGILLLVSCQQEEIMDYDLDGKVYFYERVVQGGGEVKVEAKTYSFATKNSTLMTDVLQIRTRLMGKVTDYDRVFRAAIVAEGTTAVEGTHFKLLDGVIKAGEYESYLPVEIYRTADTKEQEVVLNLKLTDTSDLTTGHPEDLSFTLTWADKLIQPATWPQWFWGAYSDNKYRFAIDQLGVSEWPTYSRYDTSKKEGYFTTAEIIRQGELLNEAYKKYKAEHGPIYMDDANPSSGEIYYGL